MTLGLLDRKLPRIATIKANEPQPPSLPETMSPLTIVFISIGALALVIVLSLTIAWIVRRIKAAKQNDEEEPLKLRRKQQENLDWNAALERNWYDSLRAVQARLLSGLNRELLKERGNPTEIVKRRVLEPFLQKAQKVELPKCPYALSNQCPDLISDARNTLSEVLNSSFEEWAIKNPTSGRPSSNRP